MDTWVARRPEMTMTSTYATAPRIQSPRRAASQPGARALEWGVATPTRGEGNIRGHETAAVDTGNTR